MVEGIAELITVESGGWGGPCGFCFTFEYVWSFS